MAHQLFHSILPQSANIACLGTRHSWTQYARACHLTVMWRGMRGSRVLSLFDCARRALLLTIIIIHGGSALLNRHLGFSFR